MTVPTDEEVLARAAACGIAVTRDPLTGMVSMSGVEILTSCIVALEQIKILHMYCRTLDDEISDLKARV